MARPLRIEHPGAVYHVTSRGNAGSKIVITGTGHAGTVCWYRLHRCHRFPTNRVNNKSPSGQEGAFRLQVCHRAFKFTLILNEAGG